MLISLGVTNKIFESKELVTERSAQLHEKAVQFAPGGVQGAARHWNPYPLYFSRANGGRLWDVDGNEFVDLWAAAGPIVLGHNDSRVLDPLLSSVHDHGVLFCLPHQEEVDLAQELCEAVPSGEMVVYGCGGSDVCLFAWRVARTFTGRQKVLKCEGHYHGWNDGLLVSVWPGYSEIGPAEAPIPVPDSDGLASSTVEDCIVIPFNDLDAVERAISENKEKIAAFFIEPILHTAGCILPDPGYLESVREICTREGILLVFDEIITGFRHHLGGYQAICGVTPDLTTLGKAMSNGLPISALVGRRDVMSSFTPTGGAYYSGTFMGQMFLVRGALETMKVLKDPDVHKHLFEMGNLLADRVTSTIERLGLNASYQYFGSIWSLYFGVRRASNYRDVAQIGHPADPTTQAFRKHLMENGFYFHPTTRRAYLMDAHTDNDIDRLSDAIETFLVENQANLR